MDDNQDATCAERHLRLPRLTELDVARTVDTNMRHLLLGNT